MPFIGRDWRSPGEAWVKTDSLGWQRMKIIESQLHPSYHHQNPACSWPPRSEFGQHMANHCKEHDCSANSRSDRNSNELNFSSSSASSSPDNSSRGGSKSPSPTCSPERNMHHIYPITISSPYGQYSCCSHHFESSSSGSPRATPNLFRANSSVGSENNNKQQNTQTAMSRSLSRESVLVDTTNSGIHPPGNKMRYNSSVPDFRCDSESASSAKLDHHHHHYRQQQQQQQQQQDVSISSDDNQIRIVEGNADNNNSKLTALLPPTLTVSNGQCKLDSNSTLDRCNHLVPENLATNNIDNNKIAAGQTTTSAASCCCAHHNQNNGQNFIYQPKEPYVRTAPHCRVSVRTREVAMYNTISEAFYRLDFCNAIHDIRRFNYICKLLHLLITQNLTSLSGCATKVLFTMLEQVAWEVSSNKRNIHVLKNLLAELKQMIQKYYCWGRPIGSSLLWQQHFDTIERISQIVDGIELAPTKSEQTQASFNNLPVEMIREILLRLNDYRDLVNSAQASPVMQNMINGQYIWQRLCRYHFTEQQLEFALNNSRSGLLARPTRNNTVRGLKYAKTTSADGRTSFRNPVVTHKSKSSNGSSSSSSSSTTRQQLERTSGRRNSRQKESSTSGNPEPNTPSTSSSYVTRTIRIFDKEKESTLTTGNNNNNNNSSGRMSKSETLTARAAEDKNQICRQQPQERPLNSSRSSHEIDWERVFHQLRKKFDLKEEYADCLLLCRHCRCLFWKSFGHPCIKNDDDEVDGDVDIAGPTNRYYNSSSLRLNHQPSACALNNCGQQQQQQQQHQNSCNCDSLSPGQDGIGHASQGGQEVGGQGRDQVLSRLSVAALSRNFDNRFQGCSSSSSLGGRNDNSENLPPAAAAAESNPLQQRQQAGQTNRQQQQQQQRRHLNDNLEASLRGRYVRMGGNDSRRLDNNENSNSNGRNNNNGNQNLTVRREELVPKHVAVSPQAFLKFFSL